MERLGCRAPSRGQSLVEMALALPVIVLLTVGVADLGRAFFYAEAVNNAARQALRTAAQTAQQSTGDNVCFSVLGLATGNASSTATLPPPSGDPLFTIGNQAAMESTFNGSPASTNIGGASLTVTWHCASGKAITNSSASTTDPTDVGSAAVRVRLTYSMKILTPFLANYLNSPVAIKADITGRAQY